VISILRLTSCFQPSATLDSHNCVILHKLLPLLVVS
jgi:hypothetical protein